MVGLFLILLTFSVQADTGKDGNSPVYLQEADKPLSQVYDKVYKSLEEARFFVVFEPNIGANLARFADKWGDNYNRNKLTAIRSMVFCNVWYANKVSNQDPNMLGLCPLHISLIERENRTTVIFNRPSVIAENSPAKELIETIEAEVIAAIESALK